MTKKIRFLFKYFQIPVKNSPLDSKYSQIYVIGGEAEKPSKSNQINCSCRFETQYFRCLFHNLSFERIVKRR